MALRGRPPSRVRRRRGMSIIEATICVVLVSTMLVAALHVLAVSRSERVVAADRGIGLLLAQALMDEILDQRYAESMATVTSAEVLLRQFMGPDNVSAQVMPSLSWAQYFKPLLPPEATSWRLTRFEVYCEDAGPANEIVEVSLHLPGAGGLPGGTIIEQLTVAESTLPGSLAWHTFDFSANTGLDPGVGLCVAFTSPSGPEAMKARAKNYGVGDADTALIQGDPIWHSAYPDMAMLYRAYGIYEAGMALGIDTGETTNDRSDFDDVDDYDGWEKSPPRRKDGTKWKELTGWTRLVSVVRVEPGDPTQTAAAESGVKRITVTVKRGDIVMATLTALATAGLPASELCCFADGSGRELPPQVCSDLGGTPQGFGTRAALCDCPPPADAGVPLNVLFISTYSSEYSLMKAQVELVPNAQDQARIDLLESWGHTVEKIDGMSDSTVFAEAMARNQVGYISLEVDRSQLNYKLTDAPIGLVNEETWLYMLLGFSNAMGTMASATDVTIADDTHEITGGFSLGRLQLTTTGQRLCNLQGTLSPDLVGPAVHPASGLPMLSLLDAGDALVSGGKAVARRVMLPWGGEGFDFNTTTPDARLMMRKAITWASGMADAPRVLFVVGDPASLSGEESLRQNLMRSWGNVVNLIDDGDSQDDFDAAAAASDAIFVSQEAVATTLGAKLNDTATGVVNESKDMIDDFGFATGLSMGGGLPTLSVDPGHPITSVFEKPQVSPYVANEWYQIANEPVAAGVQAVGTWVESPWTGKPALMALPTGADLIGGGIAAGRRVQIPWGSGQGASPVALESLSEDALLLMKRSIEWAADTGESSLDDEAEDGDGIVFEAFTDAVAGTGEVLTIAKPGGTAAGDLLIAAVATDGDAAASLAPPAGWNEITVGQEGGAVTFGVWWKVAGSAEGSQYAFTWSGWQECYGWIMRFTGHDPASPIATAGMTSGTSSSPLSTNLITGDDNGLILRLGGFDDDDINVGAPGLPGHTAITMAKSSEGQGTVSGGAGYAMQATAGDTGTSNFALTKKQQYRTVTIAVRPAP